jgi:hypothetical protein
MKRGRLGPAALVCGLALVVVAQRLAPISGPPLYDGVVVEAEYQWLTPPPGYQGGAQSATATVPVAGGQSPNLAVGTQEQPPQAQVFAGAGFLVIPLGTTSIEVSIQPVPPAAQPSDGVIAGNVYRFSLANQSGAVLTGETSGGVTIVLRGPRSLPSATIERLAGGQWTPLQTDPAGTPHTFTAVVTDFGDFTLVAPKGWAPDPAVLVAPGQVGPVAPAASTASGVPSGQTGSPAESGAPVILIAAVALAVAVVVGAAILLWFLNRPAPRPPSRGSGRAPPPSPRPRPAPVPRKRPTRPQR